MSLPSASSSRVFLRRLFVRNYKSVGKANLELSPLTALVGRNGAGKSNVLDALRFVVDALQSSLDHAVKARGGIDEVRRRSTGHPRNFGLDLELVLPDFHQATYGFEIAARAKGTFVVKAERLEIKDHRGDEVASFHREEGRVVKASVSNPPPVLADRLYLVNAAGLPDYRPVFDALAAMGFYNLEPTAMKELQNPDAGELLHGDGSNIASVVARLGSEEPDVLTRIERYLATIVPGIDRFDRVGLGPKETLQFWQKVKGSKHPWRFFASSVSDGTLRALG